MFVIERELTETILHYIHSRGMIKDCDIKKVAKQYVYMVHGLEIENKLYILDGINPEIVQQNLFEQISIFIKGLC